VKTRVLFLFGTRATSRSFSEFKILDKINSETPYEIVCALREHSKDSSKSPFLIDSKVTTFSFPGPKDSWMRHQLWLQIAMVRRRKNNKSFAFKTRRALLGDFKYSSFHSFCNYLKYILKTFFRFRSIITLISMIPLLGTYLESFTWSRIPKNSHLESLVGKVAPTLIVVVSTGSEPLLAELQKIQNLPCKWIFIPDNWDNVFTKTIFRKNPSEFWVWSEQQKEYIVRTNIAESDKIRIIGSSRFSLEARTLTIPAANTLPRSPEKLKLLYAGQESPHDEISDLIWIYESLIQHSSNLNKQIELQYRPHPTARPRSILAGKIAQLERVVVPNSNFRILPINHDQKLIYRQNQNVGESLLCVDAVIGAPTTLLLESLFYGVPSAVLLRNDNLHRTSSGNVWNSYLHFSSLTRIADFSIISREIDLLNFIQKLLFDRVLISESHLEYFVGNYSKPYFINIVNALNAVIDHKK